MVHANIIHTKRLLCYQASSLFGLGQRTRYDWRAMALKLSPKMLRILGYQLLGLLFKYSGLDVYSRAMPGLLNMCVTGCNKFSSNQL